MYEPIKKEIYEKPGKKMAQSNPMPFQPKGQQAPSKPGQGTDFKKNAIARRIAKMNNKPKPNDAEKRDGHDANS